LGISDKPDGCSGGETRSVYRAEAGTARDAGISQSATPVPEHLGSGVKQVAACINGEEDMRHEQEKGKRAQFVSGECVDHDHSALDQRRLNAQYQRQPADPDKAEHRANLAPCKEQRKYDQDADKACSGSIEQHQFGRLATTRQARIAATTNRQILAIALRTDQGMPSNSLCSWPPHK